ncbi:MAG: esterase [Rubrivivax sp.]|nr:esterase [Rubrivivax sp.]
MIFSSKATPRWQSAVAAVLAAATLGLAASCGGSTTQYDPFIPKRLLVFGDDLSTLTQTGRKYAVNGLGVNDVVDCTLEPLWVQSLAALYGFAFAECNPTAAEPQAHMRAFAGAKVADVTAQVEAQVSAGGFRDKDLATVLVGMNDVLELYAQYPGRAEDGLLAEARARGEQAAMVVNRLVDLGAKVVVSDLPDLGLTPFAIAQAAITFDPDRAALLTRLTTAFNEQLGVKVLLDGRYVGLVQAQLRFQAIARSPVSFGLANITQAACTVPLPLCTTGTLVSGALAGTYLWADETRLSSGGHVQLATLAIDRAQRNPF